MPAAPAALQPRPSPPPAAPRVLRTVLAAALLGVLIAGFAALLRSHSQAPSTAAGAGAQDRVVRSYADLPLRFEQNRGQVDAQARFTARGAGYTLFLTPSEAVLSLTRGGPAGGIAGRDAGVQDRQKAVGAVLRMRLLGAEPNPRMAGLDRLPGASNYLKGSDRSRWRTGVPGYAQVRYREVYPGIDLVYHGRQGQLEYDFRLAPGADPRRIALAFSGARRLHIDRAGDLIVATHAGPVRQQRPVAYQELPGGRASVAARYVLERGGRVRLRLARYDRTRPLVIDPVLAYATYLGGSGRERIRDIAVDSQGSAYVTGFTGSDNFPLAGAAPFDPDRGTGPPEPCPEPEPCFDAFVTKLNPQGSALAYSTYLGGNDNDTGEGIALDSAGRAYVTGQTSGGSADFPLVGAFQSVPGDNDAFLSVLSAAGSDLDYSTLLGGDDSGDPDVGASEEGTEVAVDSSGKAYVTGSTCSDNFPIKGPAPGPYQPGYSGLCDAFVSKLDPAAAGAASLVASTYLGGTESDGASGLAVGTSGPYVAGITLSSDFPTESPYQADLGGGSDAFVAKLDTNLSSLDYSTYLGGTDFDGAQGLDIDGSGEAYVSGQTSSSDLPLNAPFQGQLNGSSDAFVTKLDAQGSALVYSSYLGGDGEEFTGEIAVDSSGGAYVAGSTGSGNFPTVNPVAPRGDGGEAFLARVRPDGGGLSFSAFLGGGADELLFDNDFPVATGPSGSAYAAGSTDSTDFPTQNALQPQSNGRGIVDQHDGFIAKITPDPAGAPVVTGLSPRSGPAGTSVVIRGSGFTGATSVRFAGIPAGRVVVNSDGQITALSPPRAEGAAAVTVARGSAGSAPNPVSRFLYAEGRWSLTGPLAAARSQASATRLANGNVLVVGGCCDPDSGEPLGAAQLYDPTTGAWRATGSPNVARFGHTASLLGDGRVLLLGGCCDPDDFGPVTTAELYDPATGAWTTQGALTLGRTGHTATVLPSGKVLVTGGESFETQAELYDPVSGGSAGAGELGTGRAAHTATLLRGGKVLVAGGRTDDPLGPVPLDSAELYDPAGNGWSPASSLGAARQGHTATLLTDGSVLVAGGRERFLSVQSAELYNPTTGAWRTTSGLMRNRRGSHAAVLLRGGKVLLAGGTDGASSLNTAELYTPATNRFNSAGLLVTYRGQLDSPPFAALLGSGKVLVGGNAAGGSTELYTPAAAQAGGGLPAFAGCPPLAANVIRGTAAGNQIKGTRAGDRIFAAAGNDVVDGLAGDDCIDLGAGNDRGEGSLGNDLVLGDVGADRLSGSSGNDRLRGGPGNDRIAAGRGNDRAAGDSGRDRVLGSSGDDRISGGSANDRLRGNSGRDRITGGSGRDRISGGSGSDRIAGDSGSDRIAGDSGGDRLSGGSGGDLITGGSGADRLFGGSGNDRINARDGRRDRIDCGRGRDRVKADRVDRVARNCERVRRRR